MSAYLLLLVLTALAVGSQTVRFGDFPNQRWVLWGDRTPDTREEMESWLSARGASYEVWAQRHPRAAARLEDRGSGVHVRLEWPPSVHGLELPSSTTLAQIRDGFPAALALTLLVAAVIGLARHASRR